MQEEYVIKVENVTKKFKVFYDKGQTFKEKLLFRNRNRYENREVLKGVSFQVKKGEAIGLVGQNGCGKSTLLKLMSRIIYPDSGSITIKGRVSSLIELGAGFHPDLSGRENIYTNASIFGLTRKEIDERIEDIIDFSELREFIDNPVRTYSSGMYMRLAFSVAINVDADVLLIDEILAVGDAAFQAKCFNKLKEVKASGTTIVIVSHSLPQIEQICERSLWIYEGLLREEGDPRNVHPVYMQYMAKKNSKKGELSVVSEGTDGHYAGQPKNAIITTDGNVRIQSIELSQEAGNRTSEFSHGEAIRCKVVFEAQKRMEDVCAGIAIYRADGVHCYGTTTQTDRIETFCLEAGQHEIEVVFESMELLSGVYNLDWALATSAGIQIIYVKNAAEFSVYPTSDEIGVSAVKHYWKISGTERRVLSMDRKEFLQKAILEDKQFISAIQQRLSNEICVWGDPERLQIHETAGMVNTLFNTNSGTITVGAYTFTGHNVCVLTGTHYIDKQMEERMDYPREGRDIVIGNGVWLASNTTILGPCTIGDNAVIAAGSVVIPGTVVPPGTVYAGTPAKKIKDLDFSAMNDEK